MLEERNAVRERSEEGVSGISLSEFLAGRLSGNKTTKKHMLVILLPLKRLKTREIFRDVYWP